MIEIKVNLSEQEYYKLSLKLAFKRPLIILFSSIGLFNLISWAYIFSAGQNSYPTLVIGLIMTFMVPLSLYFSSKKVYASNQLLQEELTYYISEQQIRIVGSSFEDEYGWEEISKISISKHWVLIYRQDVLANYIPVKGFKSDKDLQQFRQWAVMQGVQIK